MTQEVLVIAKSGVPKQSSQDKEIAWLSLAMTQEVPVFARNNSDEAISKPHVGTGSCPESLR
jgi:hypothetical protein